MYVSHRPNHQMELMGCIFSSFGEPGEWGPSIFGPSNVCDCCFFAGLDVWLLCGSSS